MYIHRRADSLTHRRIPQTEQKEIFRYSYFDFDILHRLDYIDFFWSALQVKITLDTAYLPFPWRFGAQEPLWSLAMAAVVAVVVVVNAAAYWNFSNFDIATIGPTSREHFRSIVTLFRSYFYRCCDTMDARASFLVGYYSANSAQHSSKATIEYYVLLCEWPAMLIALIVLTSTHFTVSLAFLRTFAAKHNVSKIHYLILFCGRVLSSCSPCQISRLSLWWRWRWCSLEFPFFGKIITPCTLTAWHTDQITSVIFICSIRFNGKIATTTRTRTHTHTHTKIDERKTKFAKYPIKVANVKKMWKIDAFSFLKNDD